MSLALILGVILVVLISLCMGVLIRRDVEIRGRITLVNLLAILLSSLYAKNTLGPHVGIIPALAVFIIPGCLMSFIAPWFIPWIQRKAKGRSTWPR